MAPKRIYDAAKKRDGTKAMSTSLTAVIKSLSTVWTRNNESNPTRLTRKRQKKKQLRNNSLFVIWIGLNKR